MAAPSPGAPTPELLIAKLRGHGRRLFWCALVLVATCGGAAYFYDNLPDERLENWMLLAAAGAVVVLFVLIPWLGWLSRRYTITTRRVIVGGGSRRVEMSHARGYTIAVRRGLLQRLWGSGTITLSDARGQSLQLKNVPAVGLVHETLADQIEIAQILAHRDAHPITGPGGATD